MATYVVLNISVANSHATSELSNHSQQTNDGREHRTQRRILNTDGNVMAKLCAPYTIAV